MPSMAALRKEGKGEGGRGEGQGGEGGGEGRVSFLLQLLLLQPLPSCLLFFIQQRGQLHGSLFSVLLRKTSQKI